MERRVRPAPAAPGMGNAKGGQGIGQVFLFIPGVESGAVGRVNVSAATWAAVQGFFVGTPRGKVAAKGKGEVEMVFVDGLRPELSVDGRGQTPNGAFWALRGAL